MDERRWFVDLVDGEREDVGAGHLGIINGALVFTNDTNDTVTFAYAPGVWKFVEFQD